MQEGDPKYLAPEVLNNSNNITCAADIFSLGMTFLELATDLDLPRGGDLWHQLRNGQVPANIISALSGDLVEIIMKMIEKDHLRRANVDQLLNMPSIKRLLVENKRKLFYSNIVSYSKSFYASLYNAVWYFIAYPWVKLRHVLKKISFNTSKNSYYNISSNSNEEKDKNVTSTPKKLDLIDNIPLAMMQTDSDDSENENDYSMVLKIFYAYLSL